MGLSVAEILAGILIAEKRLFFGCGATVCEYNLGGVSSCWNVSICLRMHEMAFAQDVLTLGVTL